RKLHIASAWHLRGRYRTVRHTHALARGRQRQLPVHQTGARKIRRAGAHERAAAVNSPPSELRRVHAGDAVHHTRIAIRVVHVHVVHDEVPPAITAAPPRVHALIGAQRHPADIAESKTDSEATAVA